MSDRLRAALARLLANVNEARERGIWPLNEADTERLAVEPVLEALGYGPLDYRKQIQGAGADYPDYVVLPTSDCKWIIEVKEWDARLEERHERQAVNYANNNGAQWAVLTNGRLWHIYNTRAPGSIPEMLVYEADVNDVQAAAELLSKLSRESVEGGDLDREYRAREIRTAVLAELQNPSGPALRALRKAVSVTLDKNVSPEDVAEALKLILSQGAPAPPPLPAAPQVEEQQSPPAEERWYSLAELGRDGSLCTGAKAVAVRLMDGTEMQCTNWTQAGLTLVRHYGSVGRLPELPFSLCGSARGSGYFINREPANRDGSPMLRCDEIEAADGPAFVYTNLSAHSWMKVLSRFIEAINEDPGQVQMLVVRK